MRGVVSAGDGVLGEDKKMIRKTAGQADYSTFTLLLNLSRSSAITIPAAIQIMFTIAVPAFVKPDTGMIITVAAITIPMIP